MQKLQKQNKTKQSSLSLAQGRPCGCEESDAGVPYMVFRWGQNIHIIKYEMENTKNLPNGVDESNCTNTKSRILESLSK